MRRAVESPQRKVRMIPVVVTDAAGTPTLGEGQFQVSITDNGVGDFTLTYNEALARAAVVMVTPRESDLIAAVVASSVSSCQINLFDAADGTTAKDGDVNILIIGFDAPDEA